MLFFFAFLALLLIFLLFARVSVRYLCDKKAVIFIRYLFFKIRIYPEKKKKEHKTSERTKKLLAPLLRADFRFLPSLKLVFHRFFLAVHENDAMESIKSVMLYNFIFNTVFVFLDMILPHIRAYDICFTPDFASESSYLDADISLSCTLFDLLRFATFHIYFVKE